MLALLTCALMDEAIGRHGRERTEYLPVFSHACREPACCWLPWNYIIASSPVSQPAFYRYPVCLPHSALGLAPSECLVNRKSVITITTK